MIAGLLENPAFLLLLEILQKEIGAVELRMEMAGSDADALRYMNTWKVIKWVHHLLRTQPEQFKEELQDYFETQREIRGGEYFQDARIQVQEFASKQMNLLDDLN